MGRGEGQTPCLFGFTEISQHFDECLKKRTEVTSPQLTPRYNLVAGWSSPVAREAHNLEVVGSNPAPATLRTNSPSRGVFSFFVTHHQETPLHA